MVDKVRRKGNTGMGIKKNEQIDENQTADKTSEQAENNTVNQTEDKTDYLIDGRIRLNEPIVYVGETIKGVAVKGRVYSKMSQELKNWIAKFPQLTHFVGNVEYLAEATRNAKRLKALSADIVKMIEDEKGKGE